MPLDATNQELLQALFDHSPVPQWAFDRETLRFLAVNEQAIRVYGWSREEFLAMTILDIRPPEEVELLRRDLTVPAQDAAGRHRGVWLHRTRAGAVLDVEVECADMHLGGHPARLVTVRDVTAERRAIPALQHNEQRFRAILENSADALVLQSADGRPMWASASTAHMFGRPPEEIVGRQKLELVHPDDRDAIRAARAESLARPFERIRCLARYALEGQPWRWLETVRENRLDDPAVGAIVLHIRDVTEQKLAEEALRRSEESFRTAIESSPDLVVVLREGRIAYANPTVVHALGEQGADAIVGRSGLDFASPEDLARMTDALAQAARGECHPVELQLRGRHGSSARVEFRGSPVVFDGGPAVLAFGRDVTERRRLEARLTLADRMSSLGTLAAGVAHEINNPVSYALANVGFVADTIAPHLGALGPQEREEVRHALADARQGLERVRDIVRDLKTFSRGDGEALRAVELRGILDAACSMSSNEVKHRARLVRCEADERVWVRGSEGKLAQVFVNLLVNAAQAIPDGAASANEVRITVLRRSAQTVAVEIRDSGCGIPPELVPRLFDPFFTTKPKGVGTGLGLAICHNIVLAHGGAIEVESAPGRGACFRVLLSSAAPAGASAKAAPARQPGPGAVLVVDDEPRVCEAVARLLRGGEGVRALSQSRAALELIRGGARFDAVLCDVMMPEMTGVQLHAAVAAVAPEQARRFAFMTGGVFSLESRRLLADTGRPVLEKPFDREQLLACLRAVADQEAAATS